MQNLLKILEKKISGVLTRVDKINFSMRTHSIGFMGSLDNTEYIIECTIKSFKPLQSFFNSESEYWEYFKYVKNVEGGWNIHALERPEIKAFVVENYSRNHLTAKQISDISGLPQNLLYAKIKHWKLKPVYPDMKKSERHYTVTNGNYRNPVVETQISPYKKKWKKKK